MNNSNVNAIIIVITTVQCSLISRLVLSVGVSVYVELTIARGDQILCVCVCQCENIDRAQHEQSTRHGGLLCYSHDPTGCL